jgi:hypothetical protein
VNILHDIGICFISPVYEYYLVFLGRLKYGGPCLGKLFLFARGHRHLFRQLWLRRESVALRLHGRLVRGGSALR